MSNEGKKMIKRLHLLHIPKCGGLSLDLLAKILETYGINTFSAKNLKNFTDFEDYSFVSWHFGITFIDIPNTDTACILRDPLDRIVSNFLWLMRTSVLYKFGGIYLNQEIPMLDKLHYFLFEDKNFNGIKNLQTKFLCNKVDEFAMENLYLKNSKTPISLISDEEFNMHFSVTNRSKTWFLEDNVMSLEIAKLNFDKCLIKGVVDNHDAYMEQIFSWVETNFEIDIRQEFKDALVEAGVGSTLIPYYNHSSIFDPFFTEIHTTKTLKALLTPEEIAQVYADNALDLELYNYAKSKLK